MTKRWVLTFSANNRKGAETISGILVVENFKQQIRKETIQNMEIGDKIELGLSSFLTRIS
ncbi:hypothetical protein [Draconibacterium orientale]|uniref:hypothetical protein n=1 Tax=Draconibacterium orientale TaxID=1168034 RepID=UPI0029BFC57A|nr:hypothetical protein [Draconibacterium orientale]